MLIHIVRFISLSITVTILVTLLLGCTGEKQESKLKVVLLHISDICDYGWTYEAHLGAQQAAEALPYVELSEREDACSSDAPEIMKEYVETEHKVILCHSWDFGKYIEEVVPDYPDVIFCRALE